MGKWGNGTGTIKFLSYSLDLKSISEELSTKNHLTLINYSN